MESSNTAETQETRGCKLLEEVLNDGGGFLPDGLRKTLKDFVYMYRPRTRLNVAVFVCRQGGGEVTLSLVYDSEAVFYECLEACVGAARRMQANVIDAVDLCQAECRGAVDKVVKQDVKFGVEVLWWVLRQDGYRVKTETRSDNGATLTVVL
jgi:hypothetical protein